MLKEVKLIETNKYQLSISFDKATFEAAVNKVYKKQAKNIAIPGFRRGKAPRAIIEKMYGTGVFHEDAINDLLPAAYEEAVKESGLDIVSRPEFDIETLDENGLVVTAVVFVKPEAKIEGYKGIKVEKTPVVVEDSEVDAELEKVRERNARISDVEGRACQDGDIANIDYEGFVDGVAFEGGKDAGHDLAIGSHSFIPGFEEQVIGHSVGDEFDVNVTFPEAYHAEELAGKATVFKVKLNALKVKELPAIDDELASLASEFDTLDEYKADIKAKLTERKNHAAEHEVENKLIEALVDLLEADIPECMYDEEAENCVRDMDNNLRMQGLDLKTYLQYTGMTLDQMRADMRPRAISQVKTRLALEAIAKLEGIEATEEDIEEEIKNTATAYGMDVEEVKKYMPVDGVKADIQVKKAVELVKAEAVITEKKAASKKKTTKKAASDEAAEGEEKPKAKKSTKKASDAAEGEKKTTAKKTTKKAASDEASEGEEKPKAKKSTASKAKKEEAEG